MRPMRSVVTMMMVAAGLVSLGALAGAAESAPAANAPAAKSSPAKSAKPAKGKTAQKAAPVKETVEGPQVRDFRGFCDIWMQKLRDRETYNTSHIKWETHEGRVSGEYVAYGAESACSAREDFGKDPIGKMTYREMRYRREGANETAALAAPGTIIEQSDVTEIFRYAKGRWQY